ncbi:MAG TPA: Ig-like domain-containing protein [Candidatus Dormibacteraeota bacterium]|nr:Ig-like domain-containing protein [Candidatus Dormibacteraeota bacterium]
MITEDPQLETRLQHYGSVLRDEARVSPNLHARIIGRLDGRAPVRSHRFMVQLAAAAAIVLVAVGAMGVVLKLRANELAKSAPHVTSVFPADGARDVPLKGEFRVDFATRPTIDPALRAEPADATLQPLAWSGTTMTVKYAGLHPSARYQLILSADYRSHQGDKGHFEQRWSFTAEGPAQITASTPAAGETGIARNGQLSIQFAHRPAVDPVIRFEPADGTLQAGKWTDSTWALNYTGLQPLRSYRLLLDLDFGNLAANFHKDWSFTAEPGAPPKNIPLIWYATSNPLSNRPPDPNPVYRLLALDWNGTLVGSLYNTSGALQAPDGTRLFIGTEYADQAGTLLGPALGLKGGPGSFADDSRHVCAMRNATGGDFGGDGEPSWLFTGPIGGSLHRVAQVGQVGGQSGPRIVACSYQNDRAVVVEDVIMWTSEVRVIRLSTGTVIYQRQYPSSTVASSVVASHDGRYLAEQTLSPDAQGLQVYGDTLIRRTSDGTVVARLAGGQAVVAFSWDGSRVITMPAHGAVGNREVRLVDWQRGQILWRLAEPAGVAPDQAYVLAIGRPGGTDFMVAVAADGTGQAPVDQLWLVHADGAATSVAKGPIFPGFSGF